MLSTESSILNVDDDAAGRYAVTRVLRQAGYQVEEASTGVETLRLASSKPFGLVVLDVNLPDFSGFEVCRRLRSAPETSYLPVLHLSATSVNSHSRVRGLDGGADGYLTHPVEPEVLVATVRSLLRMRRAEEALRRSERKFRCLNESNVIGIVSGKGDRILEANRTFLEMVGCEPEELAAGRLSATDITAPESIDQDRKARQERLERGACAPYEKQFVRKDGSRVPALVGGATLEPLADTWVGFALDLTERKKLEQKFREAQKYESLGILAAGIAHDFNNLLTGIMGSSSLLLEKARPGSGDAELLKTVLEASERAAELTRQILAYSGKGRGFVRRFEVSEAILPIAERIQRSLPAGITLELGLPEDLPPIQGDINQIRQVVINLVANASEAIAPQPGTIRISAGSIPDLGQVYIEVRDTGHGMDAETQSKMFDPFFSTRFLGRGLGLAAVSGIVRSHGGSMHVDSAPNRGTAVQVRLPVA